VRSVDLTVTSSMSVARERGEAVPDTNGVDPCTELHYMPRWTAEYRPVVDTAKPAATGMATETR